jgi:hypothetical protein
MEEFVKKVFTLQKRRKLFLPLFRNLLKESQKLKEIDLIAYTYISESIKFGFHK